MTDVNDRGGPRGKAPVVARAVHDWDRSQSVSGAVVSCLAEYLDADPRDLDPLEHAVDTDALDSLFAPRANDHPRCQGEITFPFQGYSVTVRAEGEILIRAPGAGLDPV